MDHSNDVQEGWHMTESVVRSSLSLPVDMAYLGPLLAFVGGVCRVAGCGPEDAAMITLAVEEAASNVVRHGQLEGEAAAFEVLFEVGKAAITVDVRDQGVPFDPQLLASTGAAAACGGDPDHGLGILLMKGAMDRVEFRNLGKNGKSVLMTRYLRHRKIDVFFSHARLHSPVSADAPARAPFQVRPMKPAEAIEVSRCAYRAYDYTYRELIYYPERIRELNEHGAMKSYLAVDATGAVVGHLALTFAEPGAPIADMTTAFVNPSCRGLGILRMLNDAVIAEAERTGMEGLYCDAVVSHVASQRAALHSGFVPTGIILRAIYAGLDYKALVGAGRQRGSCVLMYRSLRPRPRRDLWVPESYAPLVRSIASWCDLHVEPHSTVCPLPDRAPGGGEGNKASRLAEYNFAEVRIAGFGLDSLAEVKHRTRDFLREKIDAIYLTLNAEAQEAVSFAEACREMGYVFCGYLPWGMGGQDALILQLLADPTLDPEQINLVDHREESILETILQELSNNEMRIG
jgi:anti-sigma regulatory factor (Ser/Thr protein kinase)